MKNVSDIVVQKISEKLINALTGQNNNIIYEAPEESIFLGAFSDLQEAKTQGEMYPNSLGVSFSIPKANLLPSSVLNIHFSCDFYYRLTPTYEEQINYLIRVYKEYNQIQPNTPFTFTDLIHRLFTNFVRTSGWFSDLRQQEQQEVITYLEQIQLEELDVRQYFRQFLSMFKHLDANHAMNAFLETEITSHRFVDLKTFIAPKYRRVPVEDIQPLTLPLAKLNEINRFVNQYKEKYNEIIYDYAQSTKNDILNLKRSLKLIDIITEEKYQKQISDRNDIMVPNWEVDFKIDCQDEGQEFVFEIELTNKNMPAKSSKTAFTKYPYSLKMYNAKITVKAPFAYYKPCHFCFSKIEINDLAESYRYHVEKYASGMNCNTVEWKDEQEWVIETTNIAKYEEKRRVTREHPNLSLKFKDYMTDPLPHLRNILTAMQTELKELHPYIERFRVNPDYYAKALADVKAFEREVNRFEFGILCLENKYNALNAFKYLNETFNLSASVYDSWRLFQLVFIVSNIPDLIVGTYGEDDLRLIRNYQTTDLVDILYFGTGGGKTEAFLGCVIFSLFFDRLRGKDKGITAIVKYPLRLLSMQQLERFASKLAHANQVKEQHGIPGECFSLGYFVGGGNTPNQVDDYEKAYEENALDPDKFKLLSTCPNCRQNVMVKVDVEQAFIIHTCENPDCSYHEAIPFLFIDQEIYRKPPSVMISTLDKFAIMAFNPNFRSLFYLDDEHMADPAPTLVITDEIHLIKESLGTFSSHYESVFNFYCRELIGNLGKKTRKIKYMGATATISNYQHQAKELYMQDATLFPALSPNIERDFYSEVKPDQITRINIAMYPFGVSPVTYILDMIRIYRETIAHLIENVDTEFADAIANIGREAVLDTLYAYYIMIQYNNSKRDASRVRNGIDTYVNSNLKADPKYQVSSQTILTGDSEFSEVKGVLAKIDQAKNPITEDVPDYITATSMISHGVDSRKFNAIFFLGLPNLFAEYIQAYSRVGRHLTGFVFNVIRSRIRETSFLANFKEYLEYKELLITPIPISRYSIGALKKTFNGILLSLMNIYFAPYYGMEVGRYMDFKQLLLQIGEKNLQKLMRRVYSHDETEGKQYNELIADLIHETFVYINESNHDNRYRIHDVIYRVNSTHERPMRSLRDTDRTVKIELIGGDD